MTATLPGRRTPPFGGVNATVLALELRRVLRNRRTLVFALVLPAVLFLSFSVDDWDGRVGSGNVASFVLVSMGLYGSAMTAASGGAAIATERSLGWSRQLRLTPLTPAAYVTMKAIVSLVLGALAIAAVNLTGVVQRHAAMPVPVWVGCALLTLASTSVFAALGVFLGYLLPGDTAVRVIGPGLAVLSFLGDVFIPLDRDGVLYRISEWTPMFGVAEISRAPLTGELPWTAVVNAVVWLALFIAGAAWSMGRDTARV